MNSLHYIFTVLLLSVLSMFFSSCNVSNNNQTRPPLQFDDLQIQYIKTGGWVNRSELTIEPTGEAVASVLSHGSGEILDRVSFMLNEEQKRRITVSLSLFSTYKRFYQPNKYRTDQDQHTLIMNYEGNSDTVSVYNPERASLPKKLILLLKDIEQLHQSALESKPD